MKILLKCFCSCLKKQDTHFKERLYLEGTEKVEEYFDIVRIIKTLRKVDLLTKILLANHQIQALRFSKEYVIGRMSKDNENEKEEDEVPDDRKLEEYIKELHIRATNR